MIICSKCGHDNPMGHIFCTNCRTKLDLQQVTEEDMARARIPPGRKWKRLLLVLVLLLIAAIGLALWPAAVGAQAGSKADLQQARRKLVLLDKRTPVPQVFSEAELNACLEADLNLAGKKDALRLKAIQVQLKPNAAVLTVTLSCTPTLPGDIQLGSFDMVYGITGVPEIENGRFRFIVSRGKIGHLPLPGPLSLLVAPRVKAHFKALRANYPALGAVQRLQLDEGKVTVSME